MITGFEFATAGRIVFGSGTVSRLPEIASSLGRIVLLVTGGNPSRYAGITDALTSAGCTCETLSVPSEPTVEDMERHLTNLRGAGIQLVVAIGGGSVIDAGKALAILLANPGPIVDYLEVIGANRPFENLSMPCIAIPTTAGTGSEVTRNAVLRSLEHGVKVSLRHPSILPRVAIVDPELTLTMPMKVTASTGFDALTHLIEPFVCNQTNPIVDALCREGITKLTHWIKYACENPNFITARENMALCGTLGGLALTNARLGAVHGLAGAIGGLYNAPHGMVCAALLPKVFYSNASILRIEGKTKPAQRKLLDRFTEISRLLTGNKTHGFEAGSAYLEDLRGKLYIPDLSHWGVTEDDLPALAQKAMQSGSMKGNPVPLPEPILVSILHSAL